MIAGVDEAGRGPLAGPVVAAAVILPDHHTIGGLDDSKKLTAKKRARLEIEIMDCACFSVAQCCEGEIDEINILQATMLAMTRAPCPITCWSMATGCHGGPIQPKR